MILPVTASPSLIDIQGLVWVFFKKEKLYKTRGREGGRKLRE
jgi:hypothetical protein